MLVLTLIRAVVNRGNKCLLSEGFSQRNAELVGKNPFLSRIVAELLSRMNAFLVHSFPMHHSYRFHGRGRKELPY